MRDWLSPRFAIAFCAITGAAYAQTDVALTFHTATLTRGDRNSRCGAVQILQHHDGWTGNNVLPVDLIAAAWSIRPEQVKNLPAWMLRERYNLHAEASAPGSDEDLTLMLRNMLIGRMGLSVRQETGSAPEFRLTVDSDGPKLRASANTPGERKGVYAERNPNEPANFRTVLRGRDVAVNALAFMLLPYAGSRVVDATGLRDRYDFELTFVRATPWRGTSLPVDFRLESWNEAPYLTPPNDAPYNTRGLKLPGALRLQLGLRLESRAVLQQIVTIKRAHKPRTDR